jgi:hypothetical protein
MIKDDILNCKCNLGEKFYTLMGDKLLVNERMFKSKAFTLRDVLAHR